MTTVARAVRRFEILVDGADDAVAGVARNVEELVHAQRSADISYSVDGVPRPPSVEVRLEGAATVVSDVMTSIKALHGPAIRHDVLSARSVETGAHGPVRNDSRVGDLRSRVRIGAEALPSAIASVPVTVAIVDSGLMVSHPAFKDHLWTVDRINGRQFIAGEKNEYDISDQDGHGTGLAGTVLDAAADAPVKLMAAKFFDSTNPTRPDNAAAALEFVLEMVRTQKEEFSPKIILLAWDVGLGSARLETAFREACQNALVVIAAGNYGSNNDWRDGQSTARAPVRYAKDYRSTTITVMATNEADEKASFSNYGPESVDLAAPGVNIVSTRRALSNATADKTRKYRVHSGTSPAAAWVAGAAALVMSRYRGLSREQVKDCLIHSVDKLPGLKCASGGRLNIGAALRLAAELSKQP